MALIDRTPLSVLVVAAVLFGLAPFSPQPHLWEKLVMLANGELSRAIDIFDLFVHGGPLLLLGWKLKREYRPHAPDVPDDTVEI
jgi:hypothetical protein